MSLLFRYLTKNNAMILLPTLAVGIGLYVLTDLFERLDNFIEAGLSVGMVLTYFVVKMPLVISQILPVIFLLSTVIQLCIMARSREPVSYTHLDVYKRQLQFIDNLTGVAAEEK